ncbi:MAG: 6-bladed beta-propeller [Candidatus Delongbacteria bacterium]|nr:6-bladed beta-propeller [Candidatus Delongbacteria bacterium]
MKIIKCLVVLSALLLVVSCTNENQTIPQKKVTLTKLYTIEGFPEGADSVETFLLDYSGTKADEKGNLIIRDKKSGSFKVFDRSGKFVSGVSKKGVGPEEIQNFSSFLIEKDTIVVFDNRVNVKKFNKNGDFVSATTLKMADVRLFEKMTPLNDSTMIGISSVYGKVDNGVQIDVELVLSDRQFNIFKTIDSNLNEKSSLDRVFFDEPVFTFSKENIFVSRRSKSEYKIKIYSFNGDYLRTINMNYARTKYNRHEIEMINKLDYLTPEESKVIYDYKPALYGMQTDKYGNIWVIRSTGIFGSDLNFDIMSEDKIIADMTIKNGDTGDSSGKDVIIKEYFYLVDYDNNLIEVYDYKIEN